MNPSAHPRPQAQVQLWLLPMLPGIQGSDPSDRGSASRPVIRRPGSQGDRRLRPQLTCNRGAASGLCVSTCDFHI